MACQVPGLGDEHYLGLFMKGLEESIRCQLRLLRPANLETAMELARDVEDSLKIAAGGRPNKGQSSVGSVFSTGSGST